MDNELLAGRTDQDLGQVLRDLRAIAVEENAMWAPVLGVNPATAVTCVKPSGTVSQLVDSASGMHDRFAKYYIRRVRADKKDPLAQLMLANAFPVEDDVTSKDVLVFSFPVKAPEGMQSKEDRSAMQQLEHWKMYQDNWCEHKPSVTIYYKDDEFLEVGNWIWNNFDSCSGVSFLPHSDHTYQQAPYEEISEEEYHKFCAKMPEDVDWGMLAEFENEDNTVGGQTLACSGNSCESVDLVSEG